MLWYKGLLKLMTKLSGKKEIKTYIFAIAGFLFAAFAKINIGVPFVLLLLHCYAKSRQPNLKVPQHLYLIFLFLLAFVPSYFTINYNLPVYLIPFSLVPLLSILLFNNLELSLLLTLAISLSVAFVSSNSFLVAILFFASGISGCIFAKGTRKRTTVIRAGIAVGVIQVLVFIFMERFWIGFPLRYVSLFINGLVSSIIVLGILPIFEYLFNTVTNISLLELADFNQPLLQRLVMEAPGTYHHSLVVGNLSESACRAVGANALLARVGAYYHDIGKLDKAEYFSENQEVRESKHDALSPEMSKLIIMNHVKEGVELAKKFRLSQSITDFIEQHHGNSLVYYFYRRALEKLEEDHEVKEDGFRYHCPKPTTKETAIVLLADSVEAASRALKEPTAGKISEIVHKVINNKFIDGQLDECDLTLKDLEKISEVFIRVLGGIYHSRINYPEEHKK